MKTTPLDSSSVQRPETVVEYHWGRIALALALLLAVIGTPLWLWLQPEEELVLTALEAPAAGMPVPAAMEADVSPFEAPDRVTVVLEPQVSAASESAAASPAPALKPEAAAPVTLAKAEPAIVATERVREATAPVASFKPTRYVARAQFASDVVNREPVDQLSSKLTIPEGGLLKVYLFLELTQLKGETVYYDWYRNGKRSARVRIKIGQQQAPVASSKFIDRNMTGDWEVRVSTESGKQIGTFPFTVAGRS